MQKKYSIFIVLVFLLISFFLISNNTRRHALVKLANQSVAVDVADTLESRTQGLSGRKDLKENAGMLFVFEKPDKYGFWMKDMNFPIDIIWINENFKVVYIKKDARPELFPETYQSDQDARYVLEVASGFAEKHNLKVGDRAEFTY